jgi:hypothetical protein
MPWLMLLKPLIFLAVMFLACRLYRPWFAGLCGYSPVTRSNHWAQEIRSLRQEIDELRKDNINRG